MLLNTKSLLIATKQLYFLSQKALPVKGGAP